MKQFLNKRDPKFNRSIELANRFLLIISLLFFFFLIYDLGFKTGDDSLYWYYTAFISLIFIAISFKNAVRILGGIKLFVLDYVILFLISIIFLFHFLLSSDLQEKYEFGLQLIMLLFLSIQVTKLRVSFNQLHLNPPMLFISSFLFLVFMGCGLLLLPNATTHEISFVNALFTAVSAVCVTGLIVVDTATAFTELGQFIILVLIQIGGLGIMTFTTFFSFFFKGKFYFENQLYVKEFVNEEKVGEIFKTILKIITFTLLFEAIGAVLIYFSIDELQFRDSTDKLKFSIFHSISAFCNAGFSTLSDGLYTGGLKFNFPLLWIISILVIVGGIGFPVIINLYSYAKAVYYNSYYRILKIKRIPTPKIISINTRIVFITTFFLLLSGTLLYYFMEKENTLKGLSLLGKITSSVFGAVTPRTAGFNNVNIGSLAMPTLLMYLLFMWIGASPGGTGGGLKTSTFAVAMLTTISISRNMNRLEVYNREIPNESIKRAFTIIHLSFVVIGLAVFMITIFDPQLKLIEVAFECFSAYSTVGLTMGITTALSVPSKVVIMITMFLGRVGTLTLLIGLIRDVKSLNYELPKESIFIN